MTTRTEIQKITGTQVGSGSLYEGTVPSLFSPEVRALSDPFSFLTPAAEPLCQRNSKPAARPLKHLFVFCDGDDERSYSSVRMSLSIRLWLNIMFECQGGAVPGSCSAVLNLNA